MSPAQAVLFRVVAPSAIARVTGLMESGKLMFEGGASMLAPLAVLAFGIRGALLCAGGLVVAIVLAGARSFSRIDLSADAAFGGAREIEDPAELLRQAPILQGVGRQALAAVARDSSIREISGGEAIVSEGEIEDVFNILLGGRARVVVGGETRRELLPGDAFGEIAVLHRVPRSPTVLAQEDCRPPEVRYNADHPAEALLRRPSELVGEHGLEPVVHAAEGDPADAIVRIAEEVDADLIVVGNKGMKGVRRVLGSVPNSVAHKAPCSVLIADTTAAA